MTYGMYALGILLHVLFKWAGWAKVNGWSAKAYLKANAAINLQAAIAAVACMFLWEAGILTMLVNGILSASNLSGTLTLTVTPLSSLAAGYMLDSIGRHFLSLLPGMAK